VNFVEKTVERRLVRFEPGSEHEKIHNILYTSARLIFMELLRSESVSSKLSPFFELVLRIRQSCCHGTLIPEERRESAKKVLIELNRLRRRRNATSEDLTGEVMGRLQRASDVSSYEHCDVCCDQIDAHDAYKLRGCQHVLCLTCMDGVQSSACPVCTMPFEKDSAVRASKGKKRAAAAILPPPPSSSLMSSKKVKVEEMPESVIDEKETIQVRHDVKSRYGKKVELGRSPKIVAMLEAIKDLGPDEKCVIFSQWTSMLDIIECELIQNGHPYCRIDGSTSRADRLAAMQRFDTVRCDSMLTPRFMLCSLRACGTGISLTRANVVYMMDSWWNAAVENQVCVLDSGRGCNSGAGGVYRRLHGDDGGCASACCCGYLLILCVHVPICFYCCMFTRSHSLCHFMSCCTLCYCRPWTESTALDSIVQCE
jgi:DNA repair protein RAD5